MLSIKQYSETKHKTCKVSDDSSKSNRKHTEY